MEREEVKQKKIGVLMGGMSAERAISLRTGEAVFKALKRLGYNPIKIDVDRAISKRLMEGKIDVAFIALHGRYGEDGCIQGLLEILGIPYTGSGVTASAIALNKVVTKRVFIAAGLPTPIFQVLNGPLPCPAGFEQRWGKDIEMPYPVIVKPATEGSTIGVKKVESVEALWGAIEEAMKYSSAVLIEEFINGSEVTFGVLEGRVFTPIEIRPIQGLYDYKSKYTPGMTEYIIPAPIGKEVCQMAKAIVQRAYQTIGCRGAARVDMVINGRGLWILEINTIPGMTETSLLPKAASGEGMDFDRLVEEILLSARLGD